MWSARGGMIQYELTIQLIYRYDEGVSALSAIDNSLFLVAVHIPSLKTPEEARADFVR